MNSRRLVLASFLVSLALIASASSASTLKITGRLVRFGCEGGRYRAEIALSNPHDFAQHPHVYVKLVREGLYTTECVEMVEYIPEVPPDSEMNYTIDFETTCESVVRPRFMLLPKRALRSNIREEIERWGQDCPPAREPY